MSLTDLAGGVAVASSLLFVWPQAVRLLRTRDTQGISPVGALWAMAGFTLWSAYGLDRALAPIWFANGQALVGFAIVLGLRLRLGDPVPGFAPRAAIATVVVLVVAIVAPAPVVGIAALVIAATGYLPQALVAWRAVDVSGVSPATYVLLALSGTLWIIYGVLRRDMLVITPNLLIVPTATVIAVRALRAPIADLDPLASP